tara:strand:- start:760 stop:1458 length:699 start_codon:yes stop_codon:yes gene_type:complete
MKVCLNYHNLGYNPQFGINKVHPIIFKNHMDICNDFNKNKNIDITITFDDGYEGVFTYCRKILNKSSIKRKIIFPIVNYIGKYNTWDSSFYLNKYKHLSKDQIKILVSEGWEVGSHTCTHKYLGNLKNDEIVNELTESKQKLEEIINDEVTSFAPPYGIIDKRVLDISKSIGYKEIFIQKNKNVIDSGSILIVKRNNIYSVDRNKNIINKINNSRLEKKKENMISSLNIITR